jgi:thiamine-monophosphate kinase
MSEFSLINRYFKSLTAKSALTAVGIGDDCAVSRIPPDCQLVSCVDTLVMGRHFPDSTCAHAIGYKSVAVNLSDVASMGATPYALLLGLSLPVELANDAWLGEFVQGLKDICTTYNVELIGGDTTRSDVLTISITALGFVPVGQAIKRSGAKVGDVICVSGEIGLASYALSQILQGKPTTLQSALDYPVPQVKLGQELLGVANSMIDISDGLGQDLGHILTASDVGAVLWLDKIPCADILNALPAPEKYQHILNGGDDYQLCFTLKKDEFERFNADNPNRIYVIGEIVGGRGLQLLDKGEVVEFEIKGWEHF